MSGVVKRLWIVACVLCGLASAVACAFGAGFAAWDAMIPPFDAEAASLAPTSAGEDERRAYSTLTGAERTEVSARIRDGSSPSVALTRVLLPEEIERADALFAADRKGGLTARIVAMRHAQDLLNDRQKAREGLGPVRYLAAIGAGAGLGLIGLVCWLLVFRLGLWIANGHSRV